MESNMEKSSSIASPLKEWKQERDRCTRSSQRDCSRVEGMNKAAWCSDCDKGSLVAISLGSVSSVPTAPVFHVQHKHIFQASINDNNRSTLWTASIRAGAGREPPVTHCLDGRAHRKTVVCPC